MDFYLSTTSDKNFNSFSSSMSSFFLCDFILFLLKIIVNPLKTHRDKIIDIGSDIAKPSGSSSDRAM